MRVTILGLLALLSGCAPALQVVASGKNAYGADLYVIDGHPQLDDATGAAAARYCNHRAMDAHTDDNGSGGQFFTFSCRRKDEHFDY